MNSYCERVKDFWNWFADHENRLSEYIGNIKAHDSEEVIGFLREGINRAIRNCNFETGGDFEISFALEGCLALTFLTTFLVGNMPEHYKEKWHFHPWKSAMSGTQLHIHDVFLSAEDLWVLPEKNEEGRRFNLLFYNETLTTIEEEQAYQIFYLLLEMTLGENICMGYLGFAEMAEAREEAMIRLSDLHAFMVKTLEDHEDSLEEDHNPCLSYSGYSMEPSENAHPRFDIIAGFTSLPGLLDEYYENETRPVFDFFKENGAKVAFITMHRNHPDDHNPDLELRNTIADRLETEILGEPGSGKEIGVILGQAIGLTHSYIDLLLYDENLFLERVGQVLQNFEETFFFYDYYQGAEPRILI